MYKFLNYLNEFHPKIRFMKEVERKGSIPFLDVHVKKRKQLATSVYRKPSFTGLGLSFLTFVPQTIKKAVVQSTIFRALRICSDFKQFDRELKLLWKFFQNNGFPTKMFDFHVKQILDGQYTTIPSDFIMPKLTSCLVLPYFGAQSHSMQKDLTDLLTSLYPYLDPKVFLRNTFTIGSIFRFKHRVSKARRHGVVYQCCCSSCGESYIGFTHVRLFTRVCQHMGISGRTGLMITSPNPSSVEDHSVECGTAFNKRLLNFTDKLAESWHYIDY